MDNSGNLKIGVLLPTRGILMEGKQPDDIKEIIAMAKDAEDAGLDSVWVGDSLTAKPRLEPLTALSAIAYQPSRVRLGTAVMLGPLRNPVSLAHTATTVDLISGGRLILGMGVGGSFNEAQKQEWINVGVDPKNRAGRFEELLKIFKPLTRGETVTFKGRHFSVENVSIKPVSTQDNGIPVLVAAHGRSTIERQYERVLLGDGSISISDYLDEYVHSLGRIEFHAKKGGVDFDNLEKTFYITVNISEDRESAAKESDRFLKLYYGINIWGDRWGPWGPSEEVVEKINMYRDAGAGTIIVRFASFNQDRQMDLFLNEVIPYIS